MSLSASFLGGANSRLLPVFIPFRFFLTALVFQAIAWLVLLFSAADLASFDGGLGPVLAATHLLTLGVLTMTVMGASYQFLPIVTRQALMRLWPARLSYWLLVSGVLILTYAMAETWLVGLDAGAGLVAAGLLVFLILTGDNLRRASSVPMVAAHGWVAILALLALVIAGFLLISDIRSGWLDHHQMLTVSHMVLAVFGFMGLFLGGFSYVLVPMFALAHVDINRLGWTQLFLSVLAISGVLLGETIASGQVLIGAAIVGFFAALTYVWAMHMSLRKGMRKRLGVSFVLIRVSWFFLVVGVLLGGALSADIPIPNGPALFGFVLLVGWLLTFLMGVLQRIMPFLASMHIADKAGKPPLLSELTAKLPLTVHASFHLLAVGLIVLGVLFESTLLIRLGAGAGVIAVAAFAVFAVHILRKL